MAKLTKDYNLAALYPDIAKEWHPNKNGDLSPEKITPGSGKKVWWICSEEHEYEASIVNRSKKRGCPFCSNPPKRVGYGNDLQSKYPNVAKQWHPTKNGDLTPIDVTAKSGKKVWWVCDAGHEWKVMIAHRSNGTECPKCSIQTSRPELYYYCELKTIFNKVEHRKKIEKIEVDIFIYDINMAIEYDGVFFHSKKIQKDVIKKQKITQLGFSIINIRQKPMKKISEDDIVIDHLKDLEVNFLDFLTQFKKNKMLSEGHIRKINSYLTIGKPQNEKLYNNLLSYLPGPLPGKSLKERFPKIAKEWHPTKNKELNPSNMNAFSHKKVWWICKKGHEYYSSIINRTSTGRGCKYCAGKSAGYGNDLQSKYPEVSKEWHPTKNLLSPADYVAGSHKKVWWQCKNGHEWEALIQNRIKNVGGLGCKQCRTLEFLYPEKAKEWHPTKNGDLILSDYAHTSHQQAWWICKKGHEWKTSIGTRSKHGCPKCNKGGWGNKRK